MRRTWSARCRFGGSSRRPRASAPTSTGTTWGCRTSNPRTTSGTPQNFLHMLFRKSDEPYRPQPAFERALDVLFILHADHEQNCSTHAMRGIGSSHADPFSALAGAAAALYGPLHGGANEAVLLMLEEIGSVKNIPGVHRRREKGRRARLMGFGHRVYKSYDPRARIVKQTADAVFEVTGRNPLLDIALELERIALEDDYFVSRRLYPNVDFYSGLIYQAMGFPVGDVPCALCHSAHGRLAGAVGRDAQRQRPEDRAAAADLHRPRRDGTTWRRAMAWHRRSGESSLSILTLGSGDRPIEAALLRGPGLAVVGEQAGRRPHRIRRHGLSRAPRPVSTASAPGSTCDRWSRLARGRPARLQIRQTRAYITRQLSADGPDRSGTAVHRHDADRARRDGEPDRAPAGPPDGRHPVHRPLRHEAVPRSGLRRRQRRRVERRVSDRARARPVRPAARVHLRARLVRRRGSRRRVDGPATTPTAAATTSRQRAGGQCARVDPAR